jgi:hypothetical protein
MASLKPEGVVNSYSVDKAKIFNNQFKEIFSLKLELSDEELNMIISCAASRKHPTIPELTINDNGKQKLLNNPNPHNPHGRNSQHWYLLENANIN